MKKLVFYTCEVRAPFNGINNGGQYDIVSNAGDVINVYAQVSGRLEYSDVLVPESYKDEFIPKLEQSFECFQIAQEYKLLEMIGESELSRFQKAIKVVAVYEFTKKTEPERPPQESQENTEMAKSSKLKYIAVGFLLLLLAGGFLYVQEKLKQEEREKDYKTELETAKRIVETILVEYKKELEDAKKLAPSQADNLTTTPPDNNSDSDESTEQLAECNRDKNKCSPPCKWEVESGDSLSKICIDCYNIKNTKTCTDEILKGHPELLPIGKIIKVPKI